ncbi:hypothetical protein [Synechococcus phage Ssp-JY38]|nr:hypothetical protein [Synechococcus phage Yong-L2-223]
MPFTRGRTLTTRECSAVRYAQQQAIRDAISSWRGALRFRERDPKYAHNMLCRAAANFRFYRFLKQLEKSHGPDA